MKKKIIQLETEAKYIQEDQYFTVTKIWKMIILLLSDKVYFFVQVWCSM